MRNYIFLLLGVLLLSACGQDVSVGINEDSARETMTIAMPDGGEIVDSQHGKEIWFAIAPMTGVEGVPANGLTQAHYFEDGTYLHNLKLNIERPENGVFYEGWIAEEEEGEWVSLGHLNSHFGDVRHGVQFRGQQDMRKHLIVHITQELDDGNPQPGLVVAKGVLKVTPR